MNKKELAKEVSVLLGMSHTESICYLNALLQVMAKGLKEGDSLMMKGFGTLSPLIQTERMGRNPMTGIPCMIPQRITVKFKPGKGLLEEINGKTE